MWSKQLRTVQGYYESNVFIPLQGMWLARGKEKSFDWRDTVQWIPVFQMRMKMSNLEWKNEFSWSCGILTREKYELNCGALKSLGLLSFRRQVLTHVLFVIFAAQRADSGWLLLYEHRRPDGGVSEPGDIVFHQRRTHDAKKFPKVTELEAGRYICCMALLRALDILQLT